MTARHTPRSRDEIEKDEQFAASGGGLILEVLLDIRDDQRSLLQEIRDAVVFIHKPPTDL